MSLNVGDKAPDFSIPDQDGKIVTLDSLKGKKVALFFYPDDDTPTCTNQACNLRDNHKLLKKQGYIVIGVSPDTPKSHIKYIAKYDLPFDLLADTELKMANDYHVWAQKTLFGRTYMGILRTTFIIDESGIITEIIRKVVSKNHANQILGK